MIMIIEYKFDLAWLLNMRRVELRWLTKDQETSRKIKSKGITLLNIFYYYEVDDNDYVYYAAYFSL